LGGVLDWEIAAFGQLYLQSLWTAQRAILGLTWELGKGATKLKSTRRMEENHRGQHLSICGRFGEPSQPFPDRS